MRQIVREGLGKMSTKENESRVTKQPIERYQWPIAGALVCLVFALLIGERRRRLPLPRVASVAALLAVILSSGGFAHAESTSAKAIDPTTVTLIRARKGSVACSGWSEPDPDGLGGRAEPDPDG